MERRLLALHAHPDDESSKGAATVARYVADGVRAVLVTATGGEAGDILNPALEGKISQSDLPGVRQAELAAAAAIIGFEDVELLGYRDSGMPGSEDNARAEALCNQDFDEVLGRVVEIVRGFRPQVVLGYDNHEWYPHPDHLFVHRITVELATAAADPSRYPDAGQPWQVSRVFAPAFTADRFVALHEAMLEKVGESPFDWVLERIEAAEPNAEARRIMRIDAAGYVEQGRDALRAHRTQIDPDGRWFAVPTSLVEEVYPWEDFEIIDEFVPTTEASGDFFEGIV